MTDFINVHGGHHRFNIPREFATSKIEDRNGMLIVSSLPVNYKPVWSINVFDEDVELKAENRVNIGN